LAPADWMRTYFRQARVIDQLTAQLMDESAPARSGLYAVYQDWRSRLSNADFSVVRGRIFVRRPTAFTDNPALLLSLFELMARHGLPLSRETEKLVKAELANDYDLLYERTFNHTGLLQAGYFYKDLTDPIYANSTSTIVGGYFDGYQKNQPVNGPKANIYGFEFAYKQHLTFLPGALGGLGVDTNYTHTKSSATFEPSTGRTDKVSLQRTAPDEGIPVLTVDEEIFRRLPALVVATVDKFAQLPWNGATQTLFGLVESAAELIVTRDPRRDAAHAHHDVEIAAASERAESDFHRNFAPGFGHRPHARSARPLLAAGACQGDVAAAPLQGM